MCGGDLTLRPSRPSDSAFLRQLFASTRETELSALGGRDMNGDAFIDLQYRAQDSSYRANFPRASFDVIERHGAPIGRFYVNRGEAETCIIDISLLPECRNAGIGRQLLEELIEESIRAGRPVILHVALGNPAQRLYHRLGFEALEHDGVHVCMRRG